MGYGSSLLYWKQYPKPIVLVSFGLLYAEDLVFMTDSKKDALKKHINLKGKMAAVGLRANAGKT